MAQLPSKRSHNCDENVETEENPPKIMKVETQPASSSSSSSGSSSSASSSSESSSSESEASDDESDSNLVSPRERHKSSTVEDMGLSPDPDPSLIKVCPLKSLGASEEDADDQDFYLDDLLSSNSGTGPVDPVYVDEDSSSHAAAASIDIDEQQMDEDTNYNIGPHLTNRKQFNKLLDTFEPPLPEDHPTSSVSPPPPPPPSLSKLIEESIEIKVECPFDNSSRERSPNESETNINEDVTMTEFVNDEDSDDEDSFDEDELEALLNENVDNQTRTDVSSDYIEKIRYSLIQKDRNHFDVLPSDWVEVPHSCGMPVYLHKPTRVVTYSKPFYIGRMSLKNHKIPVTSIPCLNYKRALQKEKTALESQSNSKEEVVNENAEKPKSKSVDKPMPLLPQARIEEATECQRRTLLHDNELREYCQNLFQFQKKTFKVFRSWSEQRRNRRMENSKYMKEVKKAANKSGQNEALGLPKGTKIITIPVVETIPDENSKDEKSSLLSQKIIRKSKKDWFINPAGKSSVCILHELLQQSMKSAPVYKFSEVDSASTPYCAVIEIGGVEYGRGYGSSKKIAKSEAARLSLELLVPEIDIDETKNGNIVSRPKDDTFFDSIRIEDPRVPEYCNILSEPAPYVILVTCLQKNYGLGDTSIQTSMTPAKHKLNEFKMKVNQREVSVICRNKRDGKQMAAQKLLQLLHPNVKFWGSLVKMYGSRAINDQKTKKEKESEVTSLQSRNLSSQSPSKAILEKLRQEMKLLHTRKKESQPIGKLSLPLNFGENYKELPEKILL